ncbi:isoprenoid biosynthesis glyoxalase ElbB [uncultured Acetobacteroides sp.]|uniref:isoprenoid biosynthesis glyoxalase ElbB n=1 Tax=uncultured Acetobacteroides sp. TaxID=1760811 RepID=UPI0029F58497|nr:isoprenoid biosynthesis glyoxalase ElbB [uncultured Acetobacteroides sp.]
MKKFAIVLSGCGVQDGAEIHESIMAMLAVDMAGCSYQLFAPDVEQFRVVNHLTGEKVSEKRNVLVESARIARGNIKPLGEYRAADYDALLFPGGFGAALNLSTYGSDGQRMKVNPEVERAVKKAYDQKKMIGAMCIAPVAIAKILGKGVLTIGSDRGTAADIESFGAKHENSGKGEVVVDANNRLFTTPCYMLNSTIKDIFEGATNLVAQMVNAMR